MTLPVKEKVAKAKPKQREVPKDLIPFIYVMKGGPDDTVFVVEPEELERARVRKNGGAYLVGHITVDTGQIIITDPCYLKGWKPGELYAEPADNDYTKSCELSMGGGGGELRIAGCTVTTEVGDLQSSGGIAVVSSTVCGDGTFPVFAHWKNGRLHRVTIEFAVA